MYQGAQAAWTTKTVDVILWLDQFHYWHRCKTDASAIYVIQGRTSPDKSHRSKRATSEQIPTQCEGLSRAQFTQTVMEVKNIWQGFDPVCEQRCWMKYIKSILWYRQVQDCWFGFSYKTQAIRHSLVTRKSCMQQCWPCCGEVLCICSYKLWIMAVKFIVVPFKDVVSFNKTKSLSNRKWLKSTWDAKSGDTTADTKATLTFPGNPVSLLGQSRDNLKSLGPLQPSEARSSGSLPKDCIACGNISWMFCNKQSQHASI